MTGRSCAALMGIERNTNGLARKNAADFEVGRSCATLANAIFM